MAFSFRSILLSKRDPNAAQWRNLLRDSSGASAVEFSLVMIVLTSLLVSVFDFANAIMVRSQLESGARAGAAYAVFTPNSYDAAEVRGAVLSGTGSSLDPSVSTRWYCTCGGAETTCSSTCSGGKPTQEYVAVTASASVDLILPYPGLESPLTLSRTATARRR